MVVMLGLMMVSCGQVDEIPPEVNYPAEEPDPDYGGPDPIAQLFRASLDLRGVRPTLAEIQRLDTEDDAYETMVHEFIDDPRFTQRIVNMYSEVFLTRADSYTVSARDYGLPDDRQFEFVRSVGDETLRVFARIIEDELPYTELVTADWTMANELLAQAWPTDYPEGETGWRQVRYTDGVEREPRQSECHQQDPVVQRLPEQGNRLRPVGEPVG